MDETYKVVIRCDHVVRASGGGGKTVRPRIATATYRIRTERTDPLTGDSIGVPEYGEWLYSAARGGRITDPLARTLSRDDRALRNATEMQRPGRDARPGPAEPRIAVECVTCHQRVVALARNLDAVMENVRHAGIHSVTISNLRANL